MEKDGRLYAYAGNILRVNLTSGRDTHGTHFKIRPGMAGGLGHRR